MEVLHMNKKIFAGVLALTISGVLCGCSNSTEKDDISDSAISTGNSDSKKTSDKNTDKSFDILSVFDNTYADYIKQQKLCTISNNFKILEAGTARDNPNGLAGAVKYDFDGDKINELVTFTFERNNTNGEDIRIDLLKIDDGKAVVSDSRYLTDMLDMDFLYPSQKGNTIYYSDLSEFQIVQSEYNGQLHFGVLLKETDYLGGLSSFNTKYSVFTIKDNKIESEAVGAVIDEAVFNISYARKIPPSISNIELSDTACIIDDKVSQSLDRAEQEKARIDEMTVDKEKYNLFTDSHSFDASYQIKGGAYESKPQAFSAMLNEFGLDIDDAYNQSHYNFVSKNQSEMKRLIQIEQLQPFGRSGAMEYIGAKLILDSDIEELLENDSPFKEPFADELALYEDIMRYPYYYPEIWNTYIDLDDTEIKYCVADIDRDGCKELIITGNNKYDFICNVSIVKNDLTVYEKDWNGTLNIYDNGTITVAETGTAYVPVHYYNFKDDSQWLSCNQKQDDSTYINAIWQDNNTSENSESFEGEEAEAKISELCSGTRLMPEFNRYYLNNYENFSELVFVDDISEIEYTWQKAYINQIEEKDTKADMEYSLIYIDNDDIPELVIGDPIDSRQGGVYTYYNDSSVELTYLTLRCNMDGYIEKSGIFAVCWRWLEEEGYYIYEMENGATNQTDTFLLTHKADGDIYTINDTEVTESVYNETYASRSAEFTKVTYCTYDEIINILNSNDKFEPDKFYKEKNDTKENAEKDTDVSSVTDNQVMTVKANGGLNLRDGAGKEYKKITLIPDGSEVSVLEQQGDWTKVQYNDYTGWVSSDYLF